MRAFVFTTFFAFLSFTVSGQTGASTIEGAVNCFNQFQTWSAKNADSSLYYVRLLAAEKKNANLLQDLLHNSFAQTFMKGGEGDETNALKTEAWESLRTAHKILDAMLTDTNPDLVAAAKPVYYWTEVQQNEGNSKELFRLANEFIATELSKSDIYENRIGRYAFLIHQVTSKKKELRAVSEGLFQATAFKLKAGQVLVNPDTAGREALSKRAWFRYLYAYSNFAKANRLQAQGNNEGAGTYFKTAFAYSPDGTDRKFASAYFYDMFFLFRKEKQTFQDDYVNFLSKNGKSHTEICSALLAMSLADPAYKEKLKSFYDAHFSRQESFASFWIRSINENSREAPPFSLQQLDGTLFSTADNKGKWILLDFWGTWCLPCRKEHPGLQKFNQSVAGRRANLILLTVACNDLESKVKSYLTQFRYDFPVAMTDGKIEKAFHVSGYPYKVLITPQGKYLNIPFGVDWVDFVSRYADL